MDLEKKKTRCVSIQAESWDDDDFQDYYYRDGTRVPQGEDVGVELNIENKGWKFYLFDEIYYP
tara:strand:+ start:40734 stop:40922 length:189 start_codon:yes stop_codon:yes gene_type:complete